MYYVHVLFVVVVIFTMYFVTCLYRAPLKSRPCGYKGTTPRYFKAYLPYFIGGIRLPCKVTGQVVISSTQLSVNIRKRGSWGTNGHRLGIVCYIEGASSYK